MDRFLIPFIRNQFETYRKFARLIKTVPRSTYCLQFVLFASVLSTIFISVLSVHPPSNDLCSMFSLQFKIHLRITYFGSFTYNVFLVSFNLEWLPGAERHLNENSQKVIQHHPSRGRSWAGKSSEWSWRFPCKMH